jgi:hypothetical protein
MALLRCEIASWKAERRSAWSPTLPHHSMASVGQSRLRKVVRHHFRLGRRSVKEASRKISATRRRSTAADSCTFVRPCFAKQMPAARLHFGTRAGTKVGRRIK